MEPLPLTASGNSWGRPQKLGGLKLQENLKKSHNIFAHKNVAHKKGWQAEPYFHDVVQCYIYSFTLEISFIGMENTELHTERK